jgi:signal transduction histidine kinase
MFIFTYTAAVLTLISVGTAAFLFLKGKKDALTFIFILYILADALWIGSNAMADVSKTDGLLIFWSGIGFSASAFIVTFFLIFVDTFVDGKLPSFNRLVLYVLPSVIFTIFSFSEYAIVDTLYPPGEPAQIIPGIQYSFYPLFLFGGLTYALVRLVLLFKRTTGVRRLQTLYIGIGFLAIIIGGVTFGVILPLLGELRFFNVAPQFSLVLVVATAYAIHKHNLFDIRKAVQRSFIYSLLFFFIISFYLSIITLTGFFIQQITPTAILVNAAITTILGIFTVPHIDKYLRKKTDRFFFKDSYDYADALYELSEKIHASVFLKDIQMLTESTLTKILKADMVAVRFVSRNNPEGKKAHDAPAALTIPIEYDGAIIGNIFLGEKRSGEGYTSEDIVLIKTFSHQIATTFEKARLYREVQEYSKELEKRVEERTKEIQQLQEAQKQMMLDISHKLQNPLTVVKSQLAFLEKKGAHDELTMFEHTIDEISAFIYDLLHLAQLETLPQEEASKTPLDLSTHTHELAEYFGVMAHERSIHLDTDIEGKIILHANKSQITELLNNLVSNAVKYCDPEKKDKWIRISLHKNNQTITLIVADNGLGIPGGDIQHVFDRFYRTQRTNSIKGTGLGLAISKRIVELHGGTITVASGKEETVFTTQFYAPF